MKEITSSNNSYIKTLLKLQEKSRERKKSGLFIIEGLREINLAIQANYSIDTLLFCEDFILENQLQNISKNTTIKLSKAVYTKLAYRSSTEGVIAVAKAKPFTLDTLQIKTKSPLILVAEHIEKPGNIGALLRTADAANIDAVLIANPNTDLYNPNVIRSSVGCVFTQQIAINTSEEIIKYLKTNNISIFATTLQNSNAYYKENYTTPTAIVVGTEATGLSTIFRKQATQNIKIPMQGKIDSMNVSVAAAIVLFEAKRQRNFK